MTQHRWVAESDDDNVCANVDCGAIVAEVALPRFLVDCPVRPCTDPTNTGGCVFVHGVPGPECSYCGQPGDYQDREVDDDGSDEDATQAV